MPANHKWNRWDADVGVPLVKEVTHNVKADPYIRIHHAKIIVQKLYICGTNSRLLHHAGGLLINPTWACTKLTWCQQLLIREWQGENRHSTKAHYDISLQTHFYWKPTKLIRMTNYILPLFHTILSLWTAAQNICWLPPRRHRLWTLSHQFINGPFVSKRLRLRNTMMTSPEASQHPYCCILHIFVWVEVKTSGGWQGQSANVFVWKFNYIWSRLSAWSLSVAAGNLLSEQAIRIKFKSGT